MRISVVIPAFNAERYVGAAIRSVLNQTLPPAEVIVVDNGSTDGTSGVAAGFGPPVRLFHEPRKGAAAARATGVAAAEGDALFFLDADDLVAPDTFAALRQGLASAPDQVAVCPWFRFREEANVWLTEPASCAPRRRGDDDLSAWLGGWYHPPCAVLWSRAAYERSGGWDPAIPVNNDGDVMMRGFVRGNRLVPVRGGTGFYRRLPGEAVSLSNTRGTRRGIASRLAVLDRIAAMLADRGALDRYRAPLLGAFATVRATAEREPELAEAAEASADAVAAGRAPAGAPPEPVPIAPVSAQAQAQEAPPRAPAAGPRVSVIIPTYDRRSTLPRAMGSVLSQDMGDLELLVVDDGSTDGTVDLVRGWDDERIRYLPQPANAGVAAARNRGLREARGAFIAFLDSDDEWCPGKLAAQLDRFAASPTNVGLVYGHAQNVDSHGTVTIRGEADGFIFAGMLAENLLHGGASSALIRREVIDTAGYFDESLPAVEDWDLFIRIARFFAVGAVDRTVVRIHDAAPAPGLERRSRHFAANMAARETLFRRYEADMRRAGVAHLFLHDCARRHLEHPDGDPAAARRLALRALKRAPLAARAWAWVPYAMLPGAPRRELRDVSRRLRAAA